MCIKQILVKLNEVEKLKDISLTDEQKKTFNLNAFPPINADFGKDVNKSNTIYDRK